MERIPVVRFCGSPQKYVAQLDVTTEVLASRWGEPDITADDLGPWLTFPFALRDGTLAALVREVENAPHPGYILTAIGRGSPRDVLAAFLREHGLAEDTVLHVSE
ncbi:hypothetical protein [Streptomyces sp. Da 82-17]|uniref:hypothetical protein n=1 Tax=Streptomyces sp. Da 82-17 TaxID=3377116 RepID=UPI0038D486FD